MTTKKRRAHSEPLAVVLEAYPGGMATLADHAGMTYDALWNFKALRHSKPPHDLLRVLAALDWSDVPFAPKGYLEWLALWRREKGTP